MKLQKGARKYIISLPCSPNAAILFIGDETVNIDIIAQTIFAQLEKSPGKSVLGVPEYMTNAELASALSRILKKKKSTVNVTLIEIT